VGLLAENPPLISMASLRASVVTKFDEGASFIFGYWVFIADRNGVLHRCMDDPTPETTSPAIPAPSPVATAPAQISLCPISKKHDSDTVPGSYPTQRSTWRPKRNSTLTLFWEEELISTPTPTPPSTRSLVGHNNTASVYMEAVRRTMTTPIGRLAPALLWFGLVLN